MNLKVIVSGLAVALLSLSLTTERVSATTFTYALSDHPDGAKTPPYSYGLRLDFLSPDLFLSFSNDNAVLTYDDATGAAGITGTMLHSLSDGSFGDEFQVTLTMTGVNNVGPLGSGEFNDPDAGILELVNLDNVSSGYGGTGLTPLLMKTDGNGTFRLLADSHRCAGHPDCGPFIGRGWVDANYTNDFLFRATPIPVPPALLLFGTALGGMGLLARRKKKAA